MNSASTIKTINRIAGEITTKAHLDYCKVVREAIRGIGYTKDVSTVFNDEDCQILLAVAGGASDRALASQLSIAPSTANARKNAALTKLRRQLAIRGFTKHEGERSGGGSE